MAINHKKKKRQSKEQNKKGSQSTSSPITTASASVALATTGPPPAVRADTDSTDANPRNTPLWKRIFEEEGADGFTLAERTHARVVNSRAKHGPIVPAFTTSRQVADMIKRGPIEGSVTQDQLDFMETYFELAFHKKMEEADDEPVGPDPTKPWWWACVHDDYFDPNVKGYFTDQRQAEISAKTSGHAN